MEWSKNALSKKDNGKTVTVRLGITIRGRFHQSNNQVECAISVLTK
jgi:hypothetical protein